ncbi:MAG: phosphate ABC transporter permease PstA [Hellea sp.]|nr:phosphate ABC transporter permease PstA [Hellea sp.]
MPENNSIHASEYALKRLNKRHMRERRFKMAGLGAIFVAVFALIWLMSSILGSGYKAFYTHSMTMDIELTESLLDPQKLREPDKLRKGNFRLIIQNSLYARFPDVTDRKARRELFDIVSSSGAPNLIRQMVYQNPDLVGQTLTIKVPTSDHVDQLLKGNIDRNVKEERRKVSDRQIAWVDELIASGEIKAGFNTCFFFCADSQDAELAGIMGAFIGSLMTLFITALIAIPIGIGAAIWLDEFAPRNKLVDFIEININNLAAVPSIIFGVLGLAIFINFFGMPRSAPIVGGLVLGLRALPTVIIATRATLMAVPQSIRDGALSVGASHIQAVFHHKLPQAGPGILTGSIIAMAQALGETAPLLMVGMVAYLTEIPDGVTDPATVLPVQIFIWAGNAERAWIEKTSAAIILLLLVLFLINGFAIWLRNKLEKRW